MSLLHYIQYELSQVSTESLELPLLNKAKLKADVLRIDKLHPVVSGNKYFKFKYHLEEAKKISADTIVTFGGAYSNHIVATAWGAAKEELKSIGIIRGERPRNLSPTLKDAAEYGMDLYFVSRNDYIHKRDNSFVKNIVGRDKNVYTVDEGGAGYAGIKGAQEILDSCRKDDYTHILCAVGTGTMLLGLAAATTIQQQIIGIPVLKGFGKWVYPYTIPGIDEWMKRIKLINDYHFGGYAKKDATLINFMNEFYRLTTIPTDFVYTAKLFYAALDLIDRNHFPEGSRLLMIHSGGLQGNRSLPANTLIF